jgi:hypothetical protein
MVCLRNISVDTLHKGDTEDDDDDDDNNNNNNNRNFTQFLLNGKVALPAVCGTAANSVRYDVDILSKQIRTLKQILSTQFTVH